MSTLTQTLEIIASEFAQQILRAVRGASLDDLAGVSGSGAKLAWTSKAAPSKTPARLGRRSSDDLAHTLQRFVAVLKHHPEGLRAEQLREALFLDRRELPRPIALGLSSGVLSKSGNRRATVYTLATDHAATETKRAKRPAAARK